MLYHSARRAFLTCVLTGVALVLSSGRPALADCTLTSLGLTPLNDLGPGVYQGFTGGLYPNGASARPAALEAALIPVATNQIQPRDINGNVDLVNGKIGMISVGMSSTSDVFAFGPQSFQPRANADAAKNPRLTIVNGADGGQDAKQWANPKDNVWKTLENRLAGAGVAPLQVQVAWVMQAHKDPMLYGPFPAHAQTFQGWLEAIARNLTTKYPNLKLAYYSSYMRCYAETSSNNNLFSEPHSYESGLSIQWMLQNQINGTGNLNPDPAQGAVVAPYLSWGPYLWADGLNPRSDGLTWDCADTDSDFVHPSSTGIAKVADQLLAFFKTDPTTTPWFLNAAVVGQPPTVTASASPASGAAPLTVNFSAVPGIPDTISEYVWTFDDGGYSYAQNPAKVFPAPGSYQVHLTVQDNSGNTVTRTVPVNVTPDATLRVGFISSSSTGEEGVTPAVLEVALEAASDQTVMVDYTVTGGTATGGGVDYTLASGFLSFAPGEISQIIPVGVVDDTLMEGNETVVVTLSNPVNAALGTIPSHTYTITDNDVDTEPPTVTITSPANGATVARRSTVTITATASDNAGVDQVEFYVGASLKCTDTAAPYSCAWSVPGKAGATYTLTATAYDAAGNTASHSVTVTAP